MNKIIILHALDILCYVSINMVGFFVVLQVFVVRKYCDFMWGTE